MDFHSLARRDLQFFCKKNKIPANLTNVAMADALQALEIVEGLDEFANQSEATSHQSPTSVAKNTARTAARTTRRTATKCEGQSSELLTRSCIVTSKSLAVEMDQENRSTNALQNSALPPSRRGAATTSFAKTLEATDVKPEANVSKTPAARSTRRSQAAASSMKNESIQRVYSTRRSVKLLEESMADLSLKTKESLNVPDKKNENVEQVYSPREKYTAGSQKQTKSDDNLEETREAEVISKRDLNASLEMEWDMKDEGSKSDSASMDLGDISFLDANTNKEQINEIESKTVPDVDSFVVVEEQETSQDEDFVVINHAASSTTNLVSCTKESETNSETEQINNDSESESDANIESETYPEEDYSSFDNSNQEAYVDSNANKVDSVTTVLIDDDISKELETESDYWSEEGEPEDIDIDSELEQAFVSDKKPQAMELESESEEEEEEEKKKTTPSSQLEAEPISVQFPRPNKPTTPTNKAALIADIEKNKENLGMNVEKNNNGEKMKMKKKKMDEEKLKDVSLRQLLKMVKQLAIKEGNNKTALHILPDTHIAE